MTEVGSVQHLRSPAPVGPPPAPVWKRPQEPVKSLDSKVSSAVVALFWGARSVSIGVALIQCLCCSCCPACVQKLVQVGSGFWVALLHNESAYRFVIHQAASNLASMASA